MFEELGDVFLDLFELVELKAGVGDGEEVAGAGLFVEEDALAVAVELFFDFEQAFAFEHDGEDESGGGVFGIVEFDEFAEEGLGGFFLDGVGGRGGRCFVGALPVGDEAFAFAGALAVLFAPAVFAYVEAMELLFLVEEQRVVGLLVFKGALAGLAGVGAGLDVPFVHCGKAKG